tara:strand:- start:1469 stop:2134 length:666 start_codon:yes stop_codon:yes gene_type:complete
MVGINIENSWKNILQEEFSKHYFKKLFEFVKNEYNSKTIYPSFELIFNAFNYCPFNNLKVIIIGQDPYHGYNQAHGLSFSVTDKVKKPPSLVNIFKEIKNDLGKEIPVSGNLEKWSKQGVLLLNSILTVREGEPGSHKEKGWELFTDSVVDIISKNTSNKVFMLWGTYAQKKGQKIDRNKHLVLESSHPSPFSAHNGFFNTNPFSQCNEYLNSYNIQEINW